VAGRTRSLGPPPSATPAWSRRVVLGAAVALIALAVWLVRMTLVVPVHVDSASMSPTYDEGDVVLVSRRPPDVADLQRGDLVVFRSPEDGRRAIKRVIGLGGESVVVLDGVLHVDAEPVAEAYVDPELVDGYYSRTFTVPDGAVFVMGDNRGNSIDSRDYGAVPGADLLGRALLHVWPPGG
jgi:signal peptidase I